MKLATAISLILILSIGVAGQALAQTRTPGVKGGDYLIYNLTTHWTSDNASDTPFDLTDLNNTKVYNVTISAVQDGNITTTQLWDFKNGTEIPFLVVWNIETAQSYYMSSEFEGIVGANLNVGDLLHPGGNDTFAVNQTITRNYASGPRETNVVELINPVQNATTNSDTNETTYNTIGNETLIYYIDKATGVLVEQNTEIDSFTAPESGSVIWTLKDTNLWTVSADSSFPEITMPIIIAIVSVVIVVVVLAVVLMMRKKGGRKR